MKDGLTAGQTRYRRRLRDARWREFREVVIEADGGRCKKCHRSEDRVSMQVHHVRYERGRLPWDYDLADCVALCAGCHMREHGILPPLDGWDLVSEHDLGELSGECEWCGTAIRFVFMIHHPKWEPMDVGCVCCDRFTGTLDASAWQHQREQWLARRDRFAESIRWREAHDGSSRIRQRTRQRVIEIAVVCDSVGAHIQMAKVIEGRAGTFVPGQRVFASEADARRHAFDVIENGTALRALEKGRR